MTENTNLNDIFTEETAPVSAEADGIIVDVLNTANNASGKYTVYPESTMRDVLSICQDISLNENDAPHCVFECNGKTTSDLSMTCSDFGLIEGGKLLINPNGKVA